MAPMSAGSVRCLSTEGGYFRLLYDSQAVCAPSVTPVVRSPTATAITDPSTTINRFCPAVIDHILPESFFHAWRGLLLSEVKLRTDLHVPRRRNPRRRQPCT